MGSSRRFRFLVAALLAAGTVFLLGCGAQLDDAAEPTAASRQRVQPTQATLAGRQKDTPTALISPVPSPTSMAPPEKVTPASSATLTPTATATPDPKAPVVLGTSVAGRPIESYRIEQGPLNVVFVGGIHGGYEWNTILLAYRALDYFQDHPEAVPPELSLHIIPNANPDGLYTVTFKTGRFQPADVFEDTLLGRFNANGVDLNRNWDCQWQPMALWGDRAVYAGERPFSEPENQALSQFLLDMRPAVVVFLHSAAEGVYAAGCLETDARSYELAGIYGRAAGYPIYERFAYYEITGDAGNWLVTQGIPSITVELKNHQDLDWEQNRLGMLALLADFGLPTGAGPLK